MCFLTVNFDVVQVHGRRECCWYKYAGGALEIRLRISGLDRPLFRFFLVARPDLGLDLGLLLALPLSTTSTFNFMRYQTPASQGKSIFFSNRGPGIQETTRAVLPPVSSRARSDR